MPNILSLTCICFNSVLYPTRFSLPIARSLCYFQPNHRCYACHTSILFSISFCLASCCKLLMKSLLLCLQN